jgi:O-antigen/teichoic acid export membrane protein
MSSSDSISMPNSGTRELLSGARLQKSSSRVLNGTLIMLMGTGLVSVLNFAYNVAMARMLGPSLFGHATAFATILMMVSALTLSFQLVGAKFIARNETPSARKSVYRGLTRRAWFVGLIVGLTLAGGSLPISYYLRLPDPWLMVVLAIGMLFYVPLGVHRGNLQGLCSFPSLATNYIVEAAVKLACSVLLVGLGYGVFGAVGGISASVLAAFILPSRAPRQSECSAAEGTFIRASFREGMQAIVFFIGQVVITNIDILLVKHYFDASIAGHYAAIALVGRLLYYASWSVISAMFPVSAAAKADEDKKGVLAVPLLVVLLMATVYVLIMALFPDTIMHLLFGASFNIGRDLLALYASATGLYALAVVLMAYEMSRKIANTGWLQLLFSGILVIAIGIFHDSLRQVIQVVLLFDLALLIAVTLPFIRTYRAEARLQQEAA